MEFLAGYHPYQLQKSDFSILNEIKYDQATFDVCTAQGVFKRAGIIKTVTPSVIMCYVAGCPLGGGPFLIHPGNS
jgi:hypothetical protein